MNRSLPLSTVLTLALVSPAAIAQDPAARAVQVHPQDIVPIHAKLKYTTLIEVPASEKIMEAATGDKEFWVVDVVGTFLDDPRRLVAVMPGLLMLCFVAGFVLLKIPTMTASLFSGHVGGHSSGLSGLVTAVVARAL